MDIPRECFEVDLAEANHHVAVAARGRAEGNLTVVKTRVITPVEGACVSG
jgi:hypothetical protein